jgi:hypothetical protein
LPEDGSRDFRNIAVFNKIEINFTMERVKVFTTFWLSKVILKISNGEEKTNFRELEKLSLRLIDLESHRLFNENCIYIYIYINLHRND